MNSSNDIINHSNLPNTLPNTLHNTIPNTIPNTLPNTLPNTHLPPNPLATSSSDTTSSDADPTIWLKQLFCGGVAGACAKTVTAPLSRIAMLYQVHSLVSTKGKVNPNYAEGVVDAGKKIIQREGPTAFWRGNGTSCLHRFPYSAINFFVYEKAFTSLERLGEEEGSYWR